MNQQLLRLSLGLFRALALLAAVMVTAGSISAADRAPLKLLFLGDNGHHRPADRAAQLMPVLRSHGISVEYTEQLDVLKPETLNQYDGLIIFANHPAISPEQEKALSDYVTSGHALIPLHCATYCFLNSPRYIEMCGAQFQRHGTGVFSTEIVEPEHPIMKGFGGFQSWDETYIHHKHNTQDRIVLEYRVQGEQAEGQKREPWTWVRTEGKGRVFYTAWGHDERTWSNPGFLQLVERGIRWACNQSLEDFPSFEDSSLFRTPTMTAKRTDVKEFEYIEVGSKIPNYTPSAQWGTQAPPLTTMQLPLDPAESLKHYVVPEGFEMQLFAAEPDLGGKPIFITWDERGRLWTCETMDYPNELQPGNKGRDRIRIVEDTDHDGKADKFTIFAEGLSIPTALAFHRGGVVVQNGTETLYLKDTNGDDKADIKEVIVSGWAMGDTHGGISNFQYGLDNWFWGMQGYNDSEPEIATGKPARFRQGFWRFQFGGEKQENQVTKLEFIRSTNNNTWGLGFSEEGLVFGSTANGNPSVFMPIANRYYERVKGWSPEQLNSIADSNKFAPVTEKVRQVDWHGGYTAAAGHALYTARAYPATWWNKTSFVCEPTGHLVGTFSLTRNGSAYQATSPCNLTASDDEWAAPIMAEVGPDGSVWVLDWYNFIVQHNPTPHGFTTGKGAAYESDLRDKKHGRIYRLVYSKSTPEATQQPKLSIDDPKGLVSALKHSNFFWRRHAQRLLVERGNPDVAKQLVALIDDSAVDSLGLNVGAIHALWTLQGLNLITTKNNEIYSAVLAALKHPSAGVRRNALQVLPVEEEVTKVILSSGLLDDSDAQVRLAAFLALADQQANDAAGAALTAYIGDSVVMTDRWLPDAVAAAAATHALPFVSAVLSVSEKKAPAGKGPEVVRIVAEHLARSRMSEEAFGKLVSSMADSMQPAVREAVLQGLSAGWPNDLKLEISPETDAKLLSLLESLPANSKGQLIQIASRIGSKKLVEQARSIAQSLIENASSDTASIEDRVSAAKQAVAIATEDGEVAESLLSLISPQTDPALASGLIAAIGSSRAANVNQLLLKNFGMFTPAAREAVVRALLSRADLTSSLIEALNQGQLQLADLKLEQKQALLAHPNRKIRDAATAMLKSGGGLPNPDRERVVQQFQRITKKAGDAQAGKPVFTKHCAVCHQHNGEGQAIGPDLSGMAVHPKAELLTHILDPSRSVEGNFRTFTVQTSDGMVLTGMLASESKTSLELIDSQGKRHNLQREEIDQLVGSNKSLMPEGFESQMTEADLTNLLEFLTSKGRFVPLPLAKVATAVSTKSLFEGGPPVGPDRMVFSDWSPKKFKDVPFVLIDPQGDRNPNLILLYGPRGALPPTMPKTVSIPCNLPLKRLHLLGGVSGWGFPYDQAKTTSVIVRVTFEDGTTEDHSLVNGEHIADYIRRVDVPKSEFAFNLNGQQLRYLAIDVQSNKVAKQVDLIKGKDDSAPMFMAITAEIDQKAAH